MDWVQGTMRPIAAIDLRRSPDLVHAVDAWHDGDHARLLDFESGPLAEYAEQAIVVERTEDGQFLYLRYGEAVSKLSGLNMLGKATGDFDTGVGGFFADSYQAALKANEPFYAVNKAKLTHHTHSWERLLLPIWPADGDSSPKVLGIVRPLAFVSDVLADFARDTGFLGGTLEPIVENDIIDDFTLLTLAVPSEIQGFSEVKTLSELYGRALDLDEADKIINASDGQTVIRRALPQSEERFGREFVIEISGGKYQPVFSISDVTSLMQARRQAEERKQQMEQFANVASDWMWETDAEDRFTLMTEAVEAVSGFSASYFIGKRRSEHSPYPENNEAFAQNAEDIAARRPFENLVFRGETVNGITRWLRINGTPRFASDGTFLGYRGTGSDITAEVNARRALEEQHAIMRDFAEVGSDWKWETDAEHRFQMISEGFDRHISPPQDFEGRTRFEIFDYPENADVFADHKEDLEARRPFRNLTYLRRDSDGAPHWIRISGKPKFDADGTFAGYRGTGTEVTAEIEANKAREAANQALADFAKTGSDWMWESDADHNMTMVTEAIERYIGWPPEHFVGRSRFGFASLPDNKDALERHQKDLKAHRPFRDLIYRIHARDGSSRWFKVSGVPLFDDLGTFTGYRGTGADITDEVEAREQAARRAKDLAEAHRMGRMGAWTMDLRTKRVHLNPEYLELVNLPAEKSELGYEEAMACFCPDSRRLIEGVFNTVRKLKRDEKLDVVWTAGQNSAMDMTVVAKPRLNARGRVYEIFGTVQDISDRKKAERDLEALAFHDPLTGLGNRAYFTRDLNQLLDTKMRGDGNGGLMLLDLDHFKEVNDTLGHAAGDELLRRVSERLSLSMAGKGTVYRLGGDEFAVLVPDVQNSAELAALANKLISAFQSPVRLNEGAVNISTSVGMVVVPAQTGNAEEGMRFADLALYEAKAEGRNRCKLFHNSLDELVQERVHLARDLRKALKEDALEAHYQLQVDVISGHVCGFEGLARWTHPTRGPIPPSKFIPIAESSRLIADLGAWMIGRVCREGRAWLDAGGEPLEMSVNLSVAQLWHRDVEHDFKSALDKSGFPPEMLCVELTESVFSDEAMPRIRRLVNGLKAVGVQIALDDFGTGYSSLQYLNSLSFDKLKIDRSFVHKCDTDREKLRLLQGIVGLGKGLGLDLIVEGVETEGELQIACDLGCRAVQGFFFAQPKPFHEACLDAAQIESEYGFNPVFWKDRHPIDPNAPFMQRIKSKLAQSRVFSEPDQKASLA